MFATLGYIHEDWFFRNDAGATYDFMFTNSNQNDLPLYRKEGTLDKNGNMSTKIKLPESDDSEITKVKNQWNSVEYKYSFKVLEEKNDLSK